VGDWTPGSWQRFSALQQPTWTDERALKVALDELAVQPPLVFAGEARNLRDDLARVSRGEAFLLQGGDCAETFAAFNANQIRDKLKVLLQMAVALTYGAQKPIVKVGRIAGQFAKPRSADTETRDGITLPSFRGDAVNGLDFTEASRNPDPQRMVQMYHQSSSTLNLVRAFTRGGFAHLERVHEWNREFVADSPLGQRYDSMATDIDRALKFLRACGVDLDDRAFEQVDFYTSHEALLLGYEQALTRQDSLTGDWFDCSAHMLWIGERTRDPDGAHVHFLSGVNNPIGCKLGPSATTDEIDALVAKLNPDNIAGRLTFITRMGADKVSEHLPPMVRHVRDRGYDVVWSCDPMHGNTFSTDNGFKTRRVEDVMAEVRGFFEVHHAEGTVPGGVHFELTGDDVTECIGGDRALEALDLEARYETACDPRLNVEQSLELAFQLAEMLHS
jgi:3-deoxy-7-phosphoheptulonate synthase